MVFEGCGDGSLWVRLGLSWSRDIILREVGDTLGVLESVWLERCSVGRYVFTVQIYVYRDKQGILIYQNDHGDLPSSLVKSDLIW